MIEQLLELVKDQVVPAITGNASIPDDKKEAAVETTTSTIFDSLKDQLIPDNLTEVMNMFSGNSAAASFGGNAMVQTVQTAVVSALTSKVGLDAGLANTIATTAVPMVMNMFTNKIKDDNEPGFNIQSLIETFTSAKGGAGGGLLGMLGGLFGSK
ncbi:MAG: hypothetical protein RL662_995 [Bacteroidota bacterium]|jgi:hypothetical protein